MSEQNVQYKLNDGGYPFGDGYPLHCFNLTS